MSEFNILFRSLHRDQKATKKVEKDVTSSKDKSTSSHEETPVNPIRAFLAKIF